MDRNLYYGDDLTFSDGSLSARRAWIEITFVQIIMSGYARSLSARRAWIEIRRRTYHKDESQESLSARRAWIEISGGAFGRLWALCRSPQGERG